MWLKKHPGDLSQRNLELLKLICADETFICLFRCCCLGGGGREGGWEAYVCVLQGRVCGGGGVAWGGGQEGELEDSETLASTQSVALGSATPATKSPTDSR